jgi:hypothetical protein
MIFKNKKVISKIFAIFSTGKCIFRARYTARMFKHVLGKEGGIQVLDGLAPSSQTVGALY